MLKEFKIAIYDILKIPNSKTPDYTPAGGPQIVTVHHPGLDHIHSLVYLTWDENRDGRQVIPLFEGSMFATYGERQGCEIEGCNLDQITQRISNY